MKKLLAVPALALGLAGCVAPQPGTIPPIFQSVMDWSRYLCGFLPTLDTISDLLNINWPPLTTAETIANSICGAVAPPTTMEASPGGWFVRDVEIRGEFV